MTPNQRLSVFLTCFGIALSYTVGAFGSAQVSYGHSATEFRELSRWLILAAALVGIVILPGKTWLPRMPKIPLICFGVLIVWGIFVVLNARSDQRYYIFKFIPNKDRLFDTGPGAIASTTAKGLVWELCIIFVYCAMVVRSVQTRTWRYLVAGMAISGVLVALIGLIHKLLGSTTIFGMKTIKGYPVELPDLFFAPFVYNANAASFMNLTMALSLGLAAHSCRGKGFSRNFYLWTGAAMVTCVGVITAASKAGVIIMVLQVGLFVVLEGRYIWSMFQRVIRKGKISLERKILSSVVVILFVGIVLLSMGSSLSRFNTLKTDVSGGKGSATMEGRSEVREIVWQLITDSEGWGGIGPGGFAHAYPFIIDSDSEILSQTRWYYAHCDPLQTILEWGYIGALAWFVLGIGSLVRAGWLGYQQRFGGEQSHLVKGMCIGLFGLGIHSTYDFPLSLLSIHLLAMTCCIILWTVPIPANDLRAQGS